MDKFLDYGKYAGVKDFTNITIITAIVAIMIIWGREQSGSQTLLARQQMRLLNREKGKVGNTNGKIMGHWKHWKHESLKHKSHGNTPKYKLKSNGNTNYGKQKWKTSVYPKS